jgi:hypothetical protein
MRKTEREAGFVGKRQVLYTGYNQLDILVKQQKKRWRGWSSEKRYWLEI